MFILVQKVITKRLIQFLPFNNYGWSKLGGESAVHMYKNSLILRICMTEKPFVHKKALTDVYFNFIFQEEVAKKIPELVKLKGHFKCWRSY